MAFATVEDLRSRWLNMPPDLPEEIVEKRLEDATVWLQVRYPDIPEPPDGNLAHILSMIVANMTRRSFNNAEFEGVTKYSETAGAFSESMSFYSGGDNLYLTKQEIELIEEALWGRQNAGSWFEALG